jgi:ubiquitin-protein ligase/DNA-directed RNA polymerase subunit RPC12/RpoP
MIMITFACGNCGKTFCVIDGLAGRKATCKTCGSPIVVPSSNPGNARRDAGATVVVPPPLPRTAAPLTSEQVITVQHRSTPPLAMPPDLPASRKDRITISGSPPPTPCFPPPLPGNPSQARPIAVPPPLPAPISSLKNIDTEPNPRKLSVRMRRLAADSEQVRKAFYDFPPIRVQATRGSPPDLYRVEYRIRGLVRGPSGTPIYQEEHLAEIQLTSEYPRQSPKCKMLTPIFHPNIEPAVICVGDHWTAAERLVDLIVRIGEMIAYQVYNIKSPLDGEAAMWADQNARFLPIDNRDMRPPGMV